MRARLAALGIVLAACSAAAAAEAELLQAFSRADLVFVGQVAGSTPGPVARSWPPIYTGTLTFEKARALRGECGDAVTLRYSIRSRAQPAFNKGARLVVAATTRTGRLQLVKSLEATEANLALARKATSVLPGWTLEGGKPVSPWAKLGKAAWPAGAKLRADAACSKSGRPALTTNTGILLRVEQIIPKNAHKFRNPFGDGKFRVTVTNTNKIAADVAALITDGGKIAWADSLFLLSGGKPYLLPGAGGLKDPRPTTLKAGESVSAVIDTLPLQGVSWPRGGYRIYFTFCLGERTASSFFYYLSRHHDKLRDALKGAR